MALNGYSGTLTNLRDQRTQYQYLNTIMEEADATDVSPTQPMQAALAQAKRQPQQQQQQPLRLREDRLHEDRRQADCSQKIGLWLSPLSDHFPTPRGFHFLSAPILPSSPSAASMDGDADTEDLSSSPNSNSPSSPWNGSSSGSGFASTNGTEFDDLYDASDDDSRAKKQRQRALRISRTSSGSRHSSLEDSRRMLPQLSIPIRTTITAPTEPDPKLCTSPMAPTPSAKVPMSPAIMSFMQKHHALAVPAASAPPSLDGSQTSEQLSQMSAQASAPPTPIIGCAEEDVDGSSWSGVQLQPGALATLQSLSRPDAGSVDGDMGPERVIEIPSEEVPPPVEMSETRAQRPLRLITSGFARQTFPFSPAQQRSLAGLTRLDIPSPGGFFSGLSPRTRHTWHLPGMTPVDSAHPPTSGTAEQFYRMPWSDAAAEAPPVSQASVEERPRHLSTSPVEQVIEVAVPVETEDPMTAFRIQQTPVTAHRLPLAETVDVVVDVAEDRLTAGSPVEEVVATEIVEDYLAIDSLKLQQTALSQLDRTEMWLVAQRAYLNGVTDLTESHDDLRSPEGERSETERPEISSPVAPAVPPKDTINTTASTAEPEAAVSMAVIVATARKKTVRFTEGVKSPALPRTLPSVLVHQESAYYRAFTNCIVRSHSSDIFIHRLPRFESLQAQRLLLGNAHRNQLLGKYQLTVVPQSAKKRMSANVVRGDDELIDDPAKLRADKEADALSQMALALWHVGATKLLNGGRLVMAPVHKRFARISQPTWGTGGRERTRILDLGGQATGDWSWHVALQYPNAKVYSVTTKAIRQLSNANVRGPSNHRQVAVERLARLPFADGQFDLVHATELHSILKLVGGNGEDEWETCLHECYRVLKPGGYLEFSLLDADIVNAGPLGNAKSVEFGFVLQTLGYDPAPTKLFLGRLDRAGFANTRRAWLCLPVGPRPSALSRPAVIKRDSTGSAVPTVELEAIVTGSTDGVAAITGLVGSWSWERWLLRTEMEKTAGELRLADTVTAGAALHEAGKSLDGVHAIVEEGRARGAAWRMLRGYARKPRSITMGTINMMLDMGGEW
ncbi:verprolin-like protein [Grosmannia clavigera kw1407]|uniref:Verprolin-like protein n=1 Tax=Grosmannia clavigera (strain kw1407 / UAMH 11150) TaxID=655863 RepID=F0XC86_GROCL|nr:verprolin-like protein [Grosmannia clavigera kw1407]EFX04100.1 verprolin-like protein [Grosmannia clavigera kw1407]